MPRKSWWARLPFAVRMTAGTSVLLIAIGGGAAGVGAMTSDEEQARIVTTAGQEAAAAAEPGTERPGHRVSAATAQFGADAATSRTSDEADRTTTRNPHHGLVPAGAAAAQARAVAVPGGTKSAAPVITTRTEVETRDIPFQTQVVRDPSLPRGTRQVQTAGVAGEQTLRYLVTLTAGRPTSRRLLDSTVTRPPQHQIVALGDHIVSPPAPTPDRRQNCGEALNSCVPLGRSAMCRAEADRQRAEESTIKLGGSVTVQDSGLEVLPTGALVC